MNQHLIKRTKFAKGLMINWRLLTSIFFICCMTVTAMLVNPIQQPPAFHLLADTRTLIIGIPNTLNVLSNLVFILVGLIGVNKIVCRDLGSAKRCWLIFVLNFIFIGFGSAGYHLAPNDVSLTWDRFPMTIGFMALFVGLMTDYVDENLSDLLLKPALLMGAAAVIYWHFYDDLRFYLWVQTVPLIMMLLFVVLFHSRYTHNVLMALGLLFFLSGLLLGQMDFEIYTITNHLISGHTLRHFSIGLGCYLFIEFLRRRKIMTPEIAANQSRLFSVNPHKKL